MHVYWLLDSTHYILSKNMQETWQYAWPDQVTELQVGLQQDNLNTYWKQLATTNGEQMHEAPKKI